VQPVLRPEAEFSGSEVALVRGPQEPAEVIPPRNLPRARF
jgi:hypothetical protein